MHSKCKIYLQQVKKIFKVNNVCGMLKSDYYVGSCSI